MAIKFPALPPAKIYGELMTPEQEVLQKLMNNQEINGEEEETLLESIVYYKELYLFLKSIDLSSITQEDAEEIVAYTNKAVNTIIYPKNIIRFTDVYRMTYVRQNFLQDDKVRDVGFISFPPLDIIKAQGIYGRANTPNSTVFYCAFDPGVAILETKPQRGDRIIIAQWHNDEAKPFVSCPVINNKTIDNENLKAATKAFEETKTYNHPLFAEIMDLYFDFFSSELVKNGEIKHPKKFEYLFSGLFSDRALDFGYNPGEDENTRNRNVDCLIYPSVANHHKSENLAVVPEAMIKLRPLKLHDGIVIDTMYDNPDVSKGKLPIAYGQIREATQFDGNRIIWNDD